MKELESAQLVIAKAIVSRFLAIILLCLLLGYAGYVSDQSEAMEQMQLANYTQPELLAHISAKSGAPMSYAGAFLLCCSAGLLFTGMVESLAFMLRWMWQKVSHL